MRVCTSSYVFDLSLSLSCSWFGTILMYRELCYYSWIIWCFSASTFLWWIEFYLWGFTIIRLNTIMDLRTLDICPAWDTSGHNGVFYWFTWFMLWHSTCGFPRWHWGNLCIGVDARYRPCFSDRNLGALFEFLCVGLNIMNLKLFDAYRIIDPRMLVVTLEYLGDIRVGWCVSYGVILLRTLGLFVALIGIAQWIDQKE